MNVTGQFQITLDEYTEALKGIQRQAKNRVAGGKLGRGIYGWVLFIALAIMLFFVLRQQQSRTAPSAPTPPPPASSNPFQIVMPFLPWLLIFAFVWFFIFRRLRGAYKRTFESTPALHRVRTMQLTDEGITMTEPTFEYRATWAHYTRFAETANLFLLFIADNSAELIPKRMFPNEIAIEEFRAALQKNINPPKRGFEVLPVGAR